MAMSGEAWEISHMPARPDKKPEAERSAKDIVERLDAMGLPEGIDSERQWTIQAGVSSSFFSNLRKSPSDPTINNLRLILRKAGSSLPEFFLEEAEGRVVRAPSRQALDEALRDALDRLPPRREQRVEYLAATLERLLGLPRTRPARRVSRRGSGAGDRAKGAPPRRATKKA